MARIEQQYIAITFADDTVGIMGFVVAEYFEDRTSGARWTQAATHEAITKEINRTAFDAWKFPVKGYRLIEPSEIPTDRAYRNAWVDTGAAVEHDMAKARRLHLERLRAERAALLPALDAQWMRATGQKNGKEADDVEAKRQALRDFPQTIAAALAAATNIDELKTITTGVTP